MSSPPLPTARLRGLRRSERAALLAVVAVSALIVVAQLAASVDLARRKRGLRERIDEELTVIPERPRALVRGMDDALLEAASTPWPGDLLTPEVAEPAARKTLLASQLLYVRAAVAELARLDALGGAVRRSEKDTFALCLRHPPAGPSVAEVRAAATRYWLGSALFEDATHDVLPLHTVHAGLRPLSRAFAAEVEEADDFLFMRRLEEEHERRTPWALALARTAASSDLLVVVADELPEGMTEPEVGKSLTASRRPAVLPRIEDTPHDVRVVVWSTASRRTLLRLRTRVDFASLSSCEGERAPSRAAAAEIHGCQAAVALLGDIAP